MIRHIAVVEPCATRAEIESFNHLVQLSPLPLTYHMPALIGPDSLFEEKPAAGIVIMGSTANICERNEWQSALSEWLRLQIERRIPIFGICYAHQLLADMFGGKVERRQDYELGFRTIKLNANALWGSARANQLYVSHQYEVTELPEEFEQVGTSESVYHAAMAHKSRPIWSFQSHPEATRGFIEREGSPSPEPAQLREGHEIMKRFLQLCASR